MNVLLRCALASLVLIAAPAGASDALCDLSPRALSLAGAWTQTVRNGIVTFRRGAPAQAVTTALYDFRADLDPAAQVAVARRSAELARHAERAAGGTPSPLVVRRVRGGGIQVCYWGVEDASRRRFLSLGRIEDGRLRHLYFEALGVTAADFARHVALVFATPAGGGASSLLPEARLPAVTPPPLLAVPPLGRR